ncbi:hypothetical protein [Streptomyces sp. NPDC051994]|uniref:hypothetical protein n=1 Tax=Streptomyces sp. NPDC051994 TaxID=3155287 RepID=UPI00342A09E6
MTASAAEIDVDQAEMIGEASLQEVLGSLVAVGALLLRSDPRQAPLVVQCAGRAVAQAEAGVQP